MSDVAQNTAIRLRETKPKVCRRRAANSTSPRKRGEGPRRVRGKFRNPRNRESETPMADPLAEARQELATANRLLANEGVLDAFGHISLRHPTKPDRYLISRYGAAELMKPSDILELTLDSKPV